MGADQDPTREGQPDPGDSLVTLDGPAGVGKSTTARAVATELGYRYLDSGALYRSVTFALLSSGIPEESWSALSADELAELGLEVRPVGETVEIRLHGRLLQDELRSEAVTRRVSRLAQVAAVRRWLYTAQRAAAREGRLVADGRDMGTVVFPEARTKIFLTADVRERARRRLGDKGVTVPGDEELLEEARRLGDRDTQDETRAVAPLRVPEGALVLDTTDLTFDAQVDRIVKHAQRPVDGEGRSGPGSVDGRPPHR